MFSKQYPVGTINGLPFKVSLLWIFAFVFFTYTFSQPTVMEQYIEIVSLLPGVSITGPLFGTITGEILFAMLLTLGVYTSVVLHEFGHVYGARKNNVGVEAVVLWVLGGAAQIKSQPESPRAEFQLTIAGPLVSLALAIITFIVAYVTVPLGITALTTFFFLMALLNTGMLILNLVPAFPLDGGRLLRAAFAHRYGYKRGTRYATRTAQLFAVSIGILSLLSLYIIGVLLSIFVFIASHVEQKRVGGTIPTAIRSPCDIEAHDDLVQPTSTTNGNTSPVTVSVERNRDSAIPRTVSSATNPEPERVALHVPGKTFVFETELPTTTLPTAAARIQQAGGTTHTYLSDETDFIVVPDGDERMYTKIAMKYDSEIISASMFEHLLNMTDHTPKATDRIRDPVT